MELQAFQSRHSPPINNYFLTLKNLFCFNLNLLFNLNNQVSWDIVIHSAHCTEFLLSVTYPGQSNAGKVWEKEALWLAIRNRMGGSDRAAGVISRCFWQRSWRSRKERIHLETGHALIKLIVLLFKITTIIMNWLLNTNNTNSNTINTVPNVSPSVVWPRDSRKWASTARLQFHLAVQSPHAFEVFQSGSTSSCHHQFRHQHLRG